MHLTVGIQILKRYLCNNQFQQHYIRKQGSAKLTWQMWNDTSNKQNYENVYYNKDQQLNNCSPQEINIFIQKSPIADRNK